MYFIWYFCNITIITLLNFWVKINDAKFQSWAVKIKETLGIQKVYTVKLQWLEHWWLIYNGCFEFVLESLGKNPIAADLI